MNSFIYLEDENLLRKANLECDKSKKLKERRRRKTSKKDDESTIFKKRKNREKENLFDSSNHIRKYYKYTKNDIQNYRNLKKIKNKISKDLKYSENIKDKETKKNVTPKKNILNEKFKKSFSKSFQQCGSFKNSLLSSDTGLADSMEHFNLLSSDPIEIDDSYYSFDTMEKSELFLNSEDYNGNSELNDADKSLLFLDENKDEFDNSNIFDSFDNETENLSNQTIIINSLEDSHNINNTEINNTEKSFLIIDDNSNNKELTGVFAQHKIENLSFKELFNRSLQNGTAPKFINKPTSTINNHNRSNSNLFMDFKKTKSTFSEDMSICSENNKNNNETNETKKSLFSSENSSNDKETTNIFASHKIENLSFKELFNRSLQNGTAPKFINKPTETITSIPRSCSNIFLDYENSKNNIKEENSLTISISEYNNHNNNEFDNIEKSLFIVGGNENMNLSNNKLLPYLTHFTSLKNFNDENIHLISTGENYFIIVTNSNQNNIKNEVYSFGSCLDDNNTTIEPTKIDYFNTIPIKQIICGKEITLFLTSDGDLYYIGTITDNNGNVIVNEVPNRIKAFRKKLNQIAMTNGYIYGISLDNKLYTWNYDKNKKYELLFNIKLNKITATEIKFNKKFKKIFTNNKYHGFVIDTDNNVYGFGSNQWGQLGLGHDDEIEDLQLLNCFDDIKIKEISCGNFHSLFLTDDGEVYSCGKNDQCQIGNNSTKVVWSPVHLGSIKNCISVAAGENHSLAIIVKEIENNNNKNNNSSNIITRSLSYSSDQYMNQNSNELIEMIDENIEYHESMELTTEKSFLEKNLEETMMNSNSFITNNHNNHNDDDNDNNNNNNNNNKSSLINPTCINTLYAWGNAECYALGTGTNKNQPIPKAVNLKVKLSPIQKSRICKKPIKRIAAGKGYSLILIE